MELSKEDIIKYLKLRLLQFHNVDINEQSINNLDVSNRDRLHLKAHLIYSLRGSFSVTSACRKVGVSRKTYYDWYCLDPFFKEMVEEVKEMKIDFFEDALITAVKNKEQGFTRLIEFALRTIGKSRGYTEEVTSYDDDEIIFTLNTGKKLLKKPEEEDQTKDTHE